MKKYFKQLSWPQRVMIIIAVMVLCIFSYYQTTGSLPLQKDTVTVSVQKSDDGQSVIKMDDPNSQEIEKEFPMNMKEDEVMDAIHKMSHQKVESSKKWGAIPLTPGRVNQLLKVVQKNEENYVNSSVYLDILERWSKGDFSSVDKDHNKIWYLQGGTVGKAVGILSAEDEKKYIEANFKVKQ
ncbi:hypothetical protein COJ85_15625 [Bacillus sp. AFS076308]|uniref:DUF6241 domain-containing protein n=1 Tax=unclassified Bacillus (in: firmicutes) TaxID=185979 RepID=UPI000BF265C9|nr:MULTISPECIES: DUF6241 domain-containing protein [unclassified Bacillus (in: firmicutes)]PFO02614.1 hypothetical protein COJ85_15625 [Bacillus sp. AFS076308]PGV55507.1 hypothetical protein COD92_02450 [Bacillus sp. AFS037270]